MSSIFTEFHSAAELDPIFDRYFGCRIIPLGFEKVGRRKWVRETGKGFKHLFEIGSDSSGFDYWPCGSLSLDFVPRLKAGKLKLQPKPKDAAVGFGFQSDVTRWEWQLRGMREGLPDRFEKIAMESVAEITTWFDAFKSVADITKAIEKVKVRGRECDFYCYPVTAMSFAFCLARSGRLDEAKAEFSRAVSSRYYEPELRPILRDMFEMELVSKS